MNMYKYTDTASRENNDIVYCKTINERNATSTVRVSYPLGSFLLSGLLPES